MFVNKYLLIFSRYAVRIRKIGIVYVHVFYPVDIKYSDIRAGVILQYDVVYPHTDEETVVILYDI